VVSWRRQASGLEEKEVNVFVLRHGVRIDGVHVSVDGHGGLRVDTVQDFRE